MENQTIECTSLIEVVYCNDDDRIIYIERNHGGEWISLNFMQGDDMDNFKKNYMHNDQQLLNFYHDFHEQYNDDDYLVHLNKIIWLFFKTKNFYSES